MPGTRHALFAESNFTSLQRSCNWPCCEVLFIAFSAYTSDAPSSSLLPKLLPSVPFLGHVFRYRPCPTRLEHCHLCPRQADSDL